MAKSLTTLREAVRRELRDPDGIRFTDPDVDHAINQAYRQAYFTVLGAQQGYFEKDPVYHSIVAGVDKIALPSDHYHTVRLEYVYSATGTTVPLKRYVRGVESRETNGTGIMRSTKPFTYDFQGAYIILSPVPSVNETDALKHTYIETLLEADDLVNPIDTIHADFKDVWCDVIVLDATIACASQIEILGGYVDKNLVSRQNAALENMRKTLGIRSYSPNQNRRLKGFFK
jgi:hypothetical protein